MMLDLLEMARLSQESKPDLEAGLATTDKDLRNLRTSFKTSIDTLKTCYLNPLMNSYTKCHQPGNDVFGRLAKLDERIRELSNNGNAFGSMKFLGGFGSGVPSKADSLARFKDLEDRLSQLETESTTLTFKVSNLEGQGGVPKLDRLEKAKTVCIGITQLSLLKIVDDHKRKLKNSFVFLEYMLSVKFTQ
jgi:hypothetical protein